MEPDIIVKPYNMSKILLEFPNRFGIAYEVKERFSFFVEGYQFSPKFKSNMWDGKIYLFDIGKGLLQFGLLSDLVLWAKDMGYKVDVHPVLVDIFVNESVSYDQVYDFSTKFLKIPFEPYEYQIESALQCINKGRLLVESPTSSGKSLILYIVAQWMKYIERVNRIVLIVPTIGLTTQMFNDFRDYAKDFEFDENEYLLIPNKEGIKKNGSLFTISTWQSLQNRSKGKGAASSVPKDFFEDVDVLMCDEVQNFKGETTGAMVQKTVNTPMKLGFSGTIANTKSDEMVLKGLFGKVFSTVSIDELTKSDIIAKAHIKCIECTFTKESIKELKSAAKGKKVSYQEEIKYLVTHPVRNKFITDIAKKFNTNTLILFNNIEQGDLMYEMLQDSGKEVLLITGKTKKEDREYAREICTKSDNVIIVASYGVFQAGISIKNLHNLLLASPTKSGIRVLQSIGRVLRKNKGKEKANVLDFYDDLTGGNKSLNFSLQHFLERYKIYTEKKFDVDVVQGMTI